MKVRSRHAHLPVTQTHAPPKIAIEGCAHGELDAIYARIAELERQHDYKVDALLICGDFQSIRNERDLECMSVPEKYRKLGEFHK
jgi:lariat debranching enzyme